MLFCTCTPPGLVPSTCALCARCEAYSFALSRSQCAQGSQALEHPQALHQQLGRLTLLCGL
eukprot:1161635-Pelagomonas_calceolata.AAC.2